MTLLRSAVGAVRPMVSRAGQPLTGSPANLEAPPVIVDPGPVDPNPTGKPEPDPPAGWGEVFWDQFSGTSLDTAKWQIVFGGGSSPNGALTWDRTGVLVNNGLTIRASKSGSAWLGAGIMQGHTATGFAGYTDFQCSVKCRFPKGQGVGGYAVAWPQNNTTPPEFDFIQTPGKEKAAVAPMLNWVGSAAGASGSYPVDLTQDHIFTVRRTNGRINYWIDGVEQVTPAAWAQHQNTAAAVIGLASFVAAAGDTAYGGPPDATTPNPYDWHVSWVRVVAPGGGAITPIPTDQPPVDPGTPGTGTAIYDPPSAWPLVWQDDFTRPPTWGVNALDPALWGQRSYGGGSAHSGSSTWNNGNGLESTGSSIKMHVTYNGGWKVDGVQQGSQNSRPNEAGYHPGYGPFHVRFRARYSHYTAPGVGWYALMWPAANDWSSEIDIVEQPGRNKTRAEATMHADQSGGYNLADHNDQGSSHVDIDLTQWHTWDCRREYTTVNGDVRATVRIWIDGVEMDQPGFWRNNSYLDERMVFGMATFVAPGWAGGWYSLPDGSTPDDSWAEVDFVRIWSPDGTPIQGSTGITIANAPGTLTEATPGSGANWTAQLSIYGYTSVQWQVRNSAGTAYAGWQTLSVAGSSMQHTMLLRQTGDRVAYRPPNDSTKEVLSSAVTILAPGTVQGIESVTTTSALTVDAGTQVTHTIKTNGMSSVGWVKVGGPPNYTWIGDPVYVSTTGSVDVVATINNTGEFVKAVPPAGVDLPTKDGPNFTVTYTPGTGTGAGWPAAADNDAATAQAFVAPLTTGWNVERAVPWSFSYNGTNLSSNKAYWSYLRGLGCTHVRLFYPWRPDVDMLGNGQTGGNTPQNGDIDRILGAAAQAISAGLKVFMDCTDVIELSEINAQSSAIRAYHDRFALRVASYSALTPSMFCLGPYNELAQQENPAFNNIRVTAHSILRQRLPNHVLLTGSAYWSNPSWLVKNDWQMVGDRKVVAQWHEYNGNPTPSGLQSQAQAFLDFSTRNGGIPVISGETGYDDDQHTGYSQRWLDHIDLYARYLGLQRPTWWVVTGGSWWRGNRSSSDPTLLSQLETAMRQADATIRGLDGWKAQNGG